MGLQCELIRSRSTGLLLDGDLGTMAFPQCFCHETGTAGILCPCLWLFLPFPEDGGLAAPSCAVCISKVLQVRSALEMGGGRQTPRRCGQYPKTWWPGIITLKNGFGNPLPMVGHVSWRRAWIFINLYLDQLGLFEKMRVMILRFLSVPSFLVVHGASQKWETPLNLSSFLVKDEQELG